MSQHRSRLIKKGTLQYLESAVSFFKKKHGLTSIDCEIEYRRHRDTGVLVAFFGRFTTLGDYDIVTNKIRIHGCDYYSRNQLVNTLFHELTHYWQSKIVKTLKRLTLIPNGELCQDFNENRSLINDWYHTYPKVSKAVYYNNVDTTNIDYRNKPHEIEARKMAEEMFQEWNMPEHKGKI